MKKLIAIITLLPFMVLAHTNSSGLIGGFGAPIYFSKYDSKKLDLVIDNQNTKWVKLMAPKDKKRLAQKIKAKLDKSKISTVLCIVNLKDSVTIKYRKEVILVQYFSDNPPSCN